MTVDIAELTDQQKAYPQVSPERFKTMEEYIRDAENIIRYYVPRVYSTQIMNTMLGSDDIISNIATKMMIGDWKWSSKYRSKKNTTKGKRGYHFQCAIWAIQNYFHRRTGTKNRNIYIDDMFSPQKRGEERFAYVIADSSNIEPIDGLIQKEGVCEIKDKIDYWLDMAELKPSERKCLKLKFQQGLTDKEISKTTGFTYRTTQHYLTRGVRKLRQIKTLIRGNIE